MKRLRVALAILVAVHSAGLMFYAEWLLFRNASVFVLLASLLSLCITDMVFLGLVRRTFR
jgi:hypothetical protein